MVNGGAGSTAGRFAGPRQMLLLTVGVSLVVALGSSRVSALTLASAGKSTYTIRVCADSTPADRHAAAELRTFLQEITGVELPLQEAGAPPADAILVGRDAEADRLLPKVNWEDLGDEGFVVATAGSRLLLAGAHPRGTLYAVYSFLDQELGCRWFAPEASYIPRQNELILPDLQRTFVPQFEYRAVASWNGADSDWATRNYVNAARDDLNDELHGGQVGWAGPSFVHTFYRLLPPDSFATHPEWYSEKDGKRFYGPGGQLCLTNPEVVKVATEQVRKWLRERPHAKLVDVSQNDGSSHGCQCAACKAVDEEEGSPSGTLLRFVNQIAANIEAEFPDVVVDTLAYFYTRQPPLKVRPRPNVSVRLCAMPACYSHRYSPDCPLNAVFCKDLDGWSKVCGRLYVWDYVSNIGNYLVPYPNLDVLGPNIKVFADHKAKGVFSQGAFASPGAEWMELRSYIIARLLWNPDYGADRARDEFIDFYYGPAAPAFRKYLALMESTMKAYPTIHFDYGAGPTSPYLTPEVISRAWEFFDEAEQLAVGRPEILRRVRTARLPVQYVALLCGPGWDEHGRARKTAAGDLTWTHQELLDQFLAAAAEAKVIREGEGLPGIQPFTPFRNRLLAVERGETVRVQAPRPPGTEALPAASIVDFQSAGFVVDEAGKVSGRRADAGASSGSCVWFSGNELEWIIQCPIPANLLPPGKRYRVFAVVKVIGVRDAGPAFKYGIYESTSRREQVHQPLSIAETSPDWRTYEITRDLGALDPHANRYVWFCGVTDSAAEKVLIDRIYLVLE
jgi:hypothetical protein